MAHVDDLLAAIRREPASPELRGVFADACLEAGDAWGEWIALGRKPRRTVRENLRERELRRAATEQATRGLHGKPVLLWRDGFVDIVRMPVGIDDTVGKLRADLATLAARPELTAVRELFVEARDLTMDEHHELVAALPALLSGLPLAFVGLPHEHDCRAEDIEALRAALPCLRGLRAAWSRSTWRQAMAGLPGLELAFGSVSVEDALPYLPRELERFVAICDDFAPPVNVFRAVTAGEFPALRTFGIATKDQRLETGVVGLLSGSPLMPRLERVVLGSWRTWSLVTSRRDAFAHVAIDPISLEVANEIAQLSAYLDKREDALALAEAVGNQRMAATLLSSFGRPEEALELGAIPAPEVRDHEALIAGVEREAVGAFATFIEAGDTLGATMHVHKLADRHAPDAGALFVELGRYTGERIATCRRALALGHAAAAPLLASALVSVGQREEAARYLDGDELLWLQRPDEAAASLLATPLEDEPCPARRSVIFLLRGEPVAPPGAVTPREIHGALRLDAPAAGFFCELRACQRETAIAAIADATLRGYHDLADRRRIALEAQPGSARVPGRRWALRHALAVRGLESLLPLVDALER